MTKRRLLVPALLLGICAGGLGCFDSVSPGGASAALSIVPVFEGFGVRDGTPNDVDSFHVVIVNPPNPDIVVGIRIAPGQDTIRLTIPLDLPTGGATVTVNFEGYSTATGLLLYSGSQSVAVAPGQQSNPQPIAAAYVGPGSGVDSVIVSPTSAQLQPGTTAQLTYTGFDGVNALPDDSVPVWYQSSDSAVARVSRSGLISAIASGTANIFVTTLANRNIRDTSVVTVSSAPQPALSLSQSSFTIPDTTGTTNPAPRTVTITNSGGGTLGGLATGTIVYGAGASGWLSPSLSGTTAPATLTLQASNSGLSAGTYTATIPVTATGSSNSPQLITVTYQLTAAGPATIRITPGYAALVPGGTQSVTLDVRDASNNVLPPTGTTFVSRSTAVATVNPTSGQITGVAAGTSIIVATLGSVSDSIVVAVVPGGRVIFSAIADTRAFDFVQVGDTVRLLVGIDLRSVGPEKLGSYTAQLSWNQAVLRYVREATVGGGFTAPTVNSTQATSGQLTYGAADANGHAGPQVSLFTVVFVAQASGLTSFTSTVTDISASSPTFTKLLPNALFVHSAVRVQ